MPGQREHCDGVVGCPVGMRGDGWADEIPFGDGDTLEVRQGVAGHRSCEMLFGFAQQVFRCGDAVGEAAGCRLGVEQIGDMAALSADILRDPFAAAVGVDAVLVEAGVHVRAPRGRRPRMVAA